METAKTELNSHKCLHEVDFAKIQSHLETIAAAQIRIEKKQSKVLDIIFGNGNDGLKTKVAVNRSSIVRQWWLIGAAIPVVSAVIIYLLK